MSLGIMEGVVDIPHLLGLRKYVWVLLSARRRTIHPHSRHRCRHHSHRRYLETQWEGQWGMQRRDASFDHGQDSRTLKNFNLSEHE